MAIPNTTDLDTELSAVNSILGAIGQSPITSLAVTKDANGNDITPFANPEVAVIYDLLKECNIDIQAEGWTFNKEDHVKYAPDANKNVKLPKNILQLSLHDGLDDKSQRLIIKDGKLYDKVDHTYEFTGDLSLDVVWLFKFENLPQVFRRYVIYCAASRAAAQLVANPQLVQMLQSKEAYARATCLEYECNQTDPSFFGLGHDQRYKSFIPLDALRR